MLNLAFKNISLLFSFEKKKGLDNLFGDKLVITLIIDSEFFTKIYLHSYNLYDWFINNYIQHKLDFHCKKNIDN